MSLEMALSHFLWFRNIYSVFMSSLSTFSIDGRLVCFHALATVNSAVMNMKVHVSLQIVVFLWGVCPGMRSLDRTVALFLVC